jgi:hypothetical protein
MKLTAEQDKIARKYGKYFNNTGGNDVVELAERPGVTFFNNYIVAELQGCMWAQIGLIQTLIKEGLMK